MTPDEQFFKLAHIKPYPVEETPAKVTRRIRIAALTADNDSLEKQLKRAKLERNVAAVLALAFFFIWSDDDLFSTSSFIASPISRTSYMAVLPL